MGERLPCTQEVIGSIPFTSTITPDSHLKLGAIEVSGAGSWEQETAESPTQMGRLIEDAPKAGGLRLKAESSLTD